MTVTRHTSSDLAQEDAFRETTPAFGVSQAVQELEIGVYAAPQPQPIIQCAVVSVFVYSCLKIPEKMLSLTLHEINRCSTCSTIVEVPTIFTLAEERASKWGRHRPNPGTSKSFKSSHLFSHFPVQCRLFSDLPHTKMVQAAETGGKATADPLQTVTNYRKLVRHILTVSE